MGILVRQEVSLATTELTYKATRVGRELALLAVGGLRRRTPVSWQSSRPSSSVLAAAGLPCGGWPR